MSELNGYMEKLMDKGWQEMSEVLDEKLPVKKVPLQSTNKKLLLVLLLLLISTAGAYYFYNNIESEIKSPNTPKQLDNTNPSEPSKSIQNIASINDEIISEFNMIERQTHEIVNSNLGNNVFKNHKEIDGYLSKEFKPVDIVNKRKGEFFPNLPLTTNSKLAFLDEIITNSIGHDSKVLDDIINKENHQKETIYIQKINQEIKDLEYSYDLSSEFYRNPDIFYSPLENCGRNAFEITLNMVSEDIQSFGGFESGVLYNYKIGKDFAIVPGLEVSYFSKNRMANSFLKTYDISKIIATDHEQNQIDNRDYNIGFRSPQVMSDFIDKLIYIGIPLSISYSHNRFNLSAGVKVSYMVYGTNYVTNKERYNDYNVIIKSSDAFYNSNVFNKIDYSLGVSFDYFISSHLALTSKFNYSYMGIINSPELQISPESPNALRSYATSALISGISDRFKGRLDRNLYFGLGLKYNFGNRCLME